MYDSWTINYEARERSRRIRQDAERERIARHAHARRRAEQPSSLAAALQYLRHIPRGRLARES